MHDKWSLQYGPTNCVSPPTQSPQVEISKINPGSQIKAANTRPDVQRLGMQLDRPDTFWKCAFCPEERSTFLALTAHI